MNGRTCLTRRGGRYDLRQNVPPDLVEVLGKHEANIAAACRRHSTNTEAIPV